MLRACARVLKPGGRLAFFVIRDQPGLSPAQRAEAKARDNMYLVTGVPYPELLARAGFEEIDAGLVGRALLTARRAPR